MKNIKNIIGGIISALVVCNMQLYANNNTPKVVVNIIVDQLRSDYLESFSPLYGKGGLKRLIEEGRLYTNVDYLYSNINRSSSVAVINTGCYPNVNGIISQSWIDRNNNELVSSVYDESVSAINKELKVSSKNLKVSTIAEELSHSTNNQSIILSISPEKDISTLSSGNSKSIALWFDEFSGKWVTSSSFGLLPSWLEKYNSSMRIGDDEFIWSPLYTSSSIYKHLNNNANNSLFKYILNSDKNKRFFNLKQTPLINSVVTNVVKYAIDHTNIGVDEVTDYLTIGYYVGTYDKSANVSSLEIQDSYVRLDRSVEELINKVENKVGRENTVFILSSTGYTDKERGKGVSYKRVLSYNRIKSLLNMFLMADYGDGQYVSSIVNGQLYFDRDFISKKKIDFTEILRKSKEFVSQVNGVYRAYTSEDIEYAPHCFEMDLLKNSYCKGVSGDIFIISLPGYYIENVEESDNFVENWNIYSAPFVLMGKNIKPEKITYRIDVRNIAPTIASIIKIRGPNGAMMKSVL